MLYFWKWDIALSYVFTQFGDFSSISTTAWKVSKYEVISGPYFPVFNPNTGKYGPEITPHLDTFHTVHISQSLKSFDNSWGNLHTKFFHVRYQVQFYLWQIKYVLNLCVGAKCYAQESW